MDLNAVVTTIDNYANTSDATFNNFDFTMQFLNTIKFCGDEDYISVAFTKYLIALFDNDFAKVNVYQQYAVECELKEKTTNGIDAIENVSKSEHYYNSRFDGHFRRVMMHVPSGRFMMHTAHSPSYNDSYVYTPWVEAFQKERVIIDYES